jgi:hypothetical protein
MLTYSPLPLRIADTLGEYRLLPSVLWGHLPAFHQGVVQSYYCTQNPLELKGLTIGEFGLVRPQPPRFVSQRHLPPIPKKLALLSDEFKKESVWKAKDWLHELTFTDIATPSGRVTCVVFLEDFTDPTYPPSRARARIALNTLIHNRETELAGLTTKRAAVLHEVWNTYPKFDLSSLPKSVETKSDDFGRDLVRLPENGAHFDFKGFQSCRFVHVVACYIVNATEGRYCDTDEILMMTQSRIALALSDQTDFRVDPQITERRRKYLLKRTDLRRCLERDLALLARLGFLDVRTCGHVPTYAVRAFCYSDEVDTALFLPPAKLLVRMIDENHEIWYPAPRRELGEIPGAFSDRVFIGGVTCQLPTLRVIESIAARARRTPILAFDYIIPREDTYRACVHLLLDCSKAVFEVSESGGQVYEIPKAFEFGIDPLLVARPGREFQGKSMLETLCDQYGAIIRTYHDYEKLSSVITEYLNK